MNRLVLFQIEKFSWRNHSIYMFVPFLIRFMQSLEIWSWTELIDYYNLHVTIWSGTEFSNQSTHHRNQTATQSAEIYTQYADYLSIICYLWFKYYRRDFSSTFWESKRMINIGIGIKRLIFQTILDTNIRESIWQWRRQNRMVPVFSTGKTADEWKTQTACDEHLWFYQQQTWKSEPLEFK